MIKRIKVNNFKSLDGVEICDMPRFLCLIGVNGSGKTTFVELLTFIRALVRGEVDKWAIGGKSCEPKALAYAGGSRRNLEISMDFSLQGELGTYTWDITYNLYDSQLIREQISDNLAGASVLRFEYGKLSLQGVDSNIEVMPRSSVISLPLNNELLKRIRGELSSFAGVGVLDPVAIADTARVVKGEMKIEENGHKLPAFVSQLSADKQREYSELIQRFYSDFDGVSVKGSKFGWKRIVFSELKKSIDALHMSYGTLRYMVMAALKYSPARLLYFDEVDNGFNQEYLAKVVDLLMSMQDKQIIVTTHNVLLLNNLSDEVLRSGVFFFYKNAARKTRVKKFFDIKEMSNALEMDSGGSIMSMTDMIALGNRLAAREI